MWYQKSMEELEADLLQAHRAVLLVVEHAKPLRDKNARLRAAIEAVLSFCEFEDDRIELKLGHTAYIAHPSEEGQFAFLIALWNLRAALAEAQGE